MPLRDIPLGQAVPDTPHSVCVSLPTEADVVGYEEHETRVRGALQAGYPRFIRHPLVAQLVDFWRSAWSLAEDIELFPVMAPTAAAALVEFACRGDDSAQSGAQVFEAGMRVQPVRVVALPSRTEASRRARRFVQHTGTGISSRVAEDLLLRAGMRQSATPEPISYGDSQAEVIDSLLPLVAPADADDIVLTTSGMNAFYAAYNAVAQAFADEGRRRWLQLGWCYLDTTCILRDMHAGPEPKLLYQVANLEAVEAALRAHPGEFAGIFAEVPTNPLIQTPELPALRTLAAKYDVPLILDPTVAGLPSVDVMKYADVLVSSLTKYAASEGDVMAGVVVVNPESRYANQFREPIRNTASGLYSRDLHRLAAQVGSMTEVTNKQSQNTIALARWLETRPEIGQVHWALGGETTGSYRMVARGADRVGGLLSIVIRGGQETAWQFYNSFPLLKSASFGTAFTMICPYPWLAHYDLVTSESGRSILAEAGIAPELLRVSVGVEPIEEIKAAFEEGFAGLR